jgi:hypothetical protein
MRRLLVGVLLVLAVSQAVGVGSYTSVSAARDVDVAVVPDEDAYLGVVPAGFDGCGNQTFLTLANQFGADVALDVDVRVVDTDGGITAFVTGYPPTLGEGDSGAVRGSIHATDGATGGGSLTLAVEAAGDGIELSLRRTYPVACASSGTEQSS